MKYRVIKPFRDFDGSMRLVGETMDLDYDRGAKLRGMRLVGIIEPEAPAPTALQTEEAKPEGRPPIETATRRPRGNTALR